MEHPANSIQNPASYTALTQKTARLGQAFQAGFLFESPGTCVLKSCAAYSRLRPVGESRCHAYPPRHWVFDYSIEYNEGAHFLTGTDASGLRTRPPRVAHLYPPGTSYIEKTDRECWMSSAWIIFESDLAFLHAMTDNRTGFARIHDPQMKLGRRLEKLAFIAASEGNAGYFQCNSIVFEILSELAIATLRLGGGGEYMIASGEASGSVAERTIRYLETHFRERLTIPVIARALGMSPSTLSHRFREESGETIIKALQRIRLEQSIPDLLRGLPLKEIAPATGFQNEFYYSKVFRRHYGVPPSEWRKRGAATCHWLRG